MRRRAHRLRLLHRRGRGRRDSILLLLRVWGQHLLLVRCGMLLLHLRGRGRRGCTRIPILRRRGQRLLLLRLPRLLWLLNRRLLPLRPRLVKP